MFNLINKNGTLNVANAKNLIKTAYKMLNGWVNPINKSKKLNIVENDTSLMVKNARINGRANWQSIMISIDTSIDLNQVKKVFGFNDYELNSNMVTLYIGAVIHELSHLDQAMNKYRFQNENGDWEFDGVAIEVSNSWRSNRFLMENFEEIATMVDTDLDNTLELNGNPWYRYEDDKEYKSISSVEEKLQEVLVAFGNLVPDGIDVWNAKIVVDGKAYKVSDTTKYEYIANSNTNYVSTVSGTTSNAVINLVADGYTKYPYNVVYA